MPVPGVSKFHRFFREVEGLNVDENDLKRYDDFVNRKLYDLLVRAEATAKANVRDIIMPFDLPITKGLQESIQQFKKLDQEIELQPVLDTLTAWPPLDLEYFDDTKAMLPEIAGGISVAVAHTFKVIDPALEMPHTEQWERTFRIFDLLL
jgi:hypothetical protein